MNPNTIAAIVALFMAAGAAGATRFGRWLAQDGDTKIVLLASVTAWFILFGLIPFGVFAILVGAATRQGVGSVATFVLNLVPFAVVAAPLVGFAQGYKLSRQRNRA